ncbi:MAG TPA: sensor histidine kinase [Solirubrobacteraceae bacterium]
MRWLRALPPRQADVLLAVAVAIAAVSEGAIVIDGAGRPFAMAALLVMSATLALRHEAPLPGLAIFFAAALPVCAAIDGTEDLVAPFLIILVWAYAVGAHHDVRTALIGLGALVVGICAVNIAFGGATVGDFLFPNGFAAAAWGAGRTLQHRTRLAAELHEAAVRADEEREAQAARAVADERRRIAREMHDVVAHSVSVMVVQAGGARRILERDPERAVEAARLIERTGRAALLEMRRLLGVLGSAEEPAAMAPQPRIEEIRSLVARAEAAGLPVTLRVDGDPRPLPAGAEAAVYRVVQEALTNALKHAGSAPTEVSLRWDDECLEVVIADRGASRSAGPELPSGGHGIVGMRERVRVYGGSLSALPVPEGGFVVRARIPLEQASMVVA